jgi:hypothetical protein
MKQFELVQAKGPERSAFDLSHERKTTLNMGELIPVMCAEILPGDTFKIDFEGFLRTLPLTSPVMHRVNLFAHAFFVPNRLLLATERWEKFITKQAEDTLPSFDITAFGVGGNHVAVNGDLLDHLGYGINPGQATPAPTPALMSQMACRAYHKIWNDYYRDQNFQAEFDIIGQPDSLLGSSTDLDVMCSIRRRAWEKDYFTAALPTQQRGNQVIVPLGGMAPVRGTILDPLTSTTEMEALVMRKVNDGVPDTGGVGLGVGDGVTKDSNGNFINVDAGLSADLSATSAGSSVTALRRAYALQRWYEASMRFGQRYVEQLLGLFKVVSKDARLQRAEFLCGGKIPVQIGEVLQTSQTDTTPQGTLTGRAVAVGQILHLNRTFDEHGWLMIIVSVLPRTSYQTLALRQNFKLDTFDFAFPQLAHLSEQPVYNAEIFNYTNGGALTGKEPFGYQLVYSEYRFIPDSVHGDFKGSLDFWSLARPFATLPALNEEFVVCTPENNIWPVDSAAGQILLQSFAKITAFRPLPKFGTPV